MQNTPLKIGNYYSNEVIKEFGGSPQFFLPSGGGEIFAARLKQKTNPELPLSVFVGDSTRRVKAAEVFRAQTKFIPVFIQPIPRPQGKDVWRYEGRFRVANRTIDPKRDAEEIQSVGRRLPNYGNIAVVLHLEREGASFDSVLAAAQDSAENDGSFEPVNEDEARERIAALIVRRRGQKRFRDNLLAAYRGCCAITGCDCVDALEAAHIRPFMKEGTNHTTNGLLLRADLHSLFDLGLIGIDEETFSVIVAERLRTTVYGSHHGKEIKVPSQPNDQPEKKAIRQHRQYWNLYA